MIMVARLSKDKPYVSEKCYQPHKIQDVHYRTDISQLFILCCSKQEEEC